jgi:hypothetical protein
MENQDRKDVFSKKKQIGHYSWEYGTFSSFLRCIKVSVPWKISPFNFTILKNLDNRYVSKANRGGLVSLQPAPLSL